MLPFSRNATHDTSTPLMPSTVDDMQDCIVGICAGTIPIAQLERSLGIDAMAFQHKTNLPTPEPQSGTVLWTYFTDIFAPVSLPSGARIKRVVYRAKRNSATGEASGRLTVFNDGADIGSILNTTSIAPTPGVGSIENFSTPAIDYVIQPGDAIQLGISQAANNSLQFYRATVFFDIPRP